jgi:hypothetical protein
MHRWLWTPAGKMMVGAPGIPLDIIIPMVYITIIRTRDIPQTKGERPMTHSEKQAIQGNNELVKYVLDDIKALWDREGFGSNEADSEPLYARLTAAIRLLDKEV